LVGRGAISVVGWWRCLVLATPSGVGVGVGIGVGVGEELVDDLLVGQTVVVAVEQGEEQVSPQRVDRIGVPIGFRGTRQPVKPFTRRSRLVCG
jgi:hypothetical protein